MVVRYTAVLLALLCLLFFSIHIQPWMPDDAFISFRYAENLTEGHGLVYNAGERVEGYTSFLWVILLAAGNRFGIDLVVFSKIMGIVFALGCIAVLFSAHRFIREIDYSISTAALFMMGSSGIFLPWGISGTEVTLFAFLILLSVLCYIKIKDSGDYRKFIILGLLCSLAMLTRPEGLLLSGTLVVYHSIAKRDFRSAAYLSAVIIFIYGPYFCWRYIYYGYPLPNTFYAKVGFNTSQVIRGIKYLMYNVTSFLLVLFPLMDPGAAYRWLKRYRGFVILPLVCGVYTIYIILIGGDSMPAFRFFVYIMPVICLLSAMFIALFGRRTMAFFIVAVLAFNITMWNFVYFIPHIKKSRVAEFGREVGTWLAANVPGDAVIATNTAGSIPYYSGLKTIDMLGLNDPHIAHRRIPEIGTGWPGHEKSDGDYVLSREPDLIQFGSSLGRKTPVFCGDYELFNNPEFRKKYVLKSIEMPSGNILHIYQRRDRPVLPEGGERGISVRLDRLAPTASMG
ncbi:MAG: hypothetical protein JSW64_13950 [Candidatus Zixiibacteriota bacterium]|nr:MAG: hypothetical protein JSW64_13950 [candidate division Zixibacteria bacterium]